MRGCVPVDNVVRPLGYCHVDGCASRRGWSRVNQLEAQTIAAWLEENRRELEERYRGAKLEQIVGIVTPFAGQMQEIREQCRQREIEIDSKTGMTVGTVHALQGAERPIIIFSPVYSKHEDGSFIDASSSMLNVTVSRAKDGLIVFGDMDVFSTVSQRSPRAPRAILAEFLFRDSENAVEFTAERRSDLKDPQEIGPQVNDNMPRTLRDAHEHDDFLLRILAGEGRRYWIISPWLVVRTMEKVGIFEAFEKARGRGGGGGGTSMFMLTPSLTSRYHKTVP